MLTLRPKLRLLKNISFALVFLCLQFQSAFARNLDEIITFPQFQELVKHKIDMVPDLKVFWDWQRQKNIRDIYAGGGRLRGLLLWIHKQLQTRSYQEVWNMAVPRFEDLAIATNVDVDRDFYTPDHLKQAVKDWMPAWDVIDQSFYNAATANGGSTLDKIRVSPIQIDDPAHGLEHFYHGQCAELSSEYR